MQPSPTVTGQAAINSDGSTIYVGATVPLQIAAIAAQAQLIAACQNGPKGYYIHIINTSGAWDAIII